MARITIEDCTNVIENRFELVALAAKRAKDINAGSATILPKENDKPSVLALREIAEGYLSREDMMTSLLNGLRKYHDLDQIEENSDRFDDSNEEDDLEEIMDYYHPDLLEENYDDKK